VHHIMPMPIHLFHCRQNEMGYSWLVETALARIVVSQR
jgi:hypothetical protein